MQPDKSPKPFSEFHSPHPIAGRRVVLAGFVLAVFAWGMGFYGLSVYSQFLGVQGRWSLGMMSAATTAYFVAGSVCIGLSDRLARAIGRRPVALTGIILLAGGACSLPHVQSAAGLFLAYAVMALGWAATSGTAITQIVGAWFIDRRGLAVSLALSGASVAGFTVVPVMVWQIALWGNAVGIAVAACGFGVLALVAVASLVEQPEDGAATREASSMRAEPVSLRWTRQQVLLVATFTVGLLAQVIFLAHQLPILTPRVGSEGAALAVGITTAAALAGRVGMGVFLDRVDHRTILAACFASQVVGLGLLLFTDSLAGVITACVLFGLSVGNLITLPALFVQREYPAPQFGLVVSRVWSYSQFFYAFGPLLAGLLIESSGSGNSAIIVSMVLQLTGIALCLSRRSADRPTVGQAA